LDSLIIEKGNAGKCTFEEKGLFDLCIKEEDIVNKMAFDLGVKHYFLKLLEWGIS
jgi:hypothetical protein